MADGDIMGMLSGMFGGGATPAADPNAPMQILPQVQQDGMNPQQPSFLDMIKSGLAKNGASGFANAGQQFMTQNKPAPVAPLPPIQFPQARQPQVYGSMMPRIGS